ncbi:MAG TPA: prolyl oligopeptidase family serine peptidase [Vicinamibacterales bacterium]|nr:prolyl oligopeptidase family serine peptidase [Vicinamibacterales bacterium]
MNRLYVILSAAALLTAQAPAQQPLTIEQLIDIRHPSAPAWSPDSRHVAYISERAGVGNIYVDDKPLTRFADGLTGGFFWGADSQRIYFPRAGDLWQAPIAGGPPSAVWTTTPAETSITASPDRTRVAFARAGRELIVRSLGDGKETTVTRADKPIGAISWTPDGSHLLFNAGAETIRHEQTPEYSGAKIIYTISERVPGESFLVAAAGGTPSTVSRLGGFGGPRWLDATHVVMDRTAPDFKHRTISVIDTAGGEPKVVREEVDAKFWSIPGQAEPNAQPSPDGRHILYLSDRDGWDHVYVDGTQLTKGRFEAWRPAWSPDGTRIAFDANEPDHPGDRHLGITSLDGRVTMITSGRGTDTAPVWSPDGTKIVYQHTDPHNSADLFVIDVASKQSRRVSESMPAAMDKSQFVEPEFVHYPGADGQQVPGWLFVPKNLDRTTKHPAVVWIHGDGINQNYDGWHVQRNYAVYYSFHQYLLQKGFIVFAPDYRGSIGYGRDWRQGVYMDVGGKDAKDAWMAANYLKTLPYVDGDRMGVWGLSYGGFFTLIAATDQPTLFRAAVDVAGVADYAMYYEDPYHGAWTASRIGTPAEHPEVYKNASPLSHVDRLARPLLVLHGTSDVNVPYLHSVRLIDELLKKNKGDLVSFMTYPGEFHYFTREHVLRDAWHRVERFFDTNLRGSGERLRDTQQ